MGAPRRNRKKYSKPKNMWNLQRITSDRSLINEYGLRNMKELWKVQTEISRIRGNVRGLLSGASSSSHIERDIIGRLSRLGVTQSDATLDSLLDIKENAILERRLQTLVFRKGLANSMKQSRQIIAHGFISINGVRVNRPSYLVKADEEKHIGYYKPIDITKKVKPQEEASAAPAPEAQGVAASEGAEAS
jgi:small subunit ribosomal protein S4